MTYLKVIICLDCSTGKQPMQSDDEKRPDDSKRVAIGSASSIKTTQSSPLLSNTALGMFYHLLFWIENLILGNILTPELLSAQLAVAQQGAQYNQFLNPYLSLFPSGGLNAYTGKTIFLFLTHLLVELRDFLIHPMKLESE